jgi:hypothetical protein
MDSSRDLLALKMKINSPGAGSHAGSHRSAVRKPPSSMKSATNKNPFVKELQSQISEKDNPKAVALMSRIEKMRVEIILNRVIDMYEALLQPKNRERYLDSIEVDSLITKEQ